MMAQYITPISPTQNIKFRVGLIGVISLFSPLTKVCHLRRLRCRWW